jgi:hypothetical protein
MAVPTRKFRGIPFERALSYPARQLQAIASMKATWEALLTALEKGDVGRAQIFVIPEGRAAFAEKALAPVVAKRIRAVSSKMSCGLESDVYGTCSFTLPANAGGSEEDITISFFFRDGVWYINE